MTPPENGKPLWDESRVETLLEDFFRKEMPPSLREERPARPRRGRLPAAPVAGSSPNPSVAKRANSLAGAVMVACTTLLMLMIGFSAWMDSPPSPRDPVTNSNPTDNPSAIGGPSESNPRGGDPLEALKHDGQGPVEMRPRIRSVGTDDSPNPAERKSPFPELDVEVYPLDRESSIEEGPHDSRSPEERRTNPERSPMPEERRQLPEHQPPAETDPEETLPDPLLPELRSIME